MARVGWPEPYIHTIYDRMYGDFPAKYTVYTPYIPMNVWFWPILVMANPIQVCSVLGAPLSVPELRDHGHREEFEVGVAVDADCIVFV